MVVVNDVWKTLPKFSRFSAFRVQRGEQFSPSLNCEEKTSSQEHSSTWKLVFHLSSPRGKILFSNPVVAGRRLMTMMTAFRRIAVFTFVWVSRNTMCFKVHTARPVMTHRQAMRCDARNDTEMPLWWRRASGENRVIASYARCTRYTYTIGELNLHDWNNSSVGSER